MANANQSPSKAHQAATAAQDLEPTAHAYDNPHLGPRQFMLAVMRDPTVSITDRMKAADMLMRIFPHESVHPSLTIRIAPFPHCTDAESGATDERLGNDSHSLEISHKAVSHSGDTTAPVNLREPPDPSTPDPPFLIDYSQPLTPSEIEEFKAAVHKLRPDFAHLPVPEFHLCPCGHWITGTYPCCKARMN